MLGLVIAVVGMGNGFEWGIIGFVKTGISLILIFGIILDAIFRTKKTIQIPLKFVKMAKLVIIPRVFVIHLLTVC